MSEFQIFYPGVYNDEDKRTLDEFRKKLENGGDAMMPMDPVETADPAKMKAYARTWDPYNPLFSDDSYAKNTKYGCTPAIPGEFEPASWFPMMPRTLGIFGMDRAKVRIPGNAHDHEIEYFAPILPGDTLTTANEKQWFEDITDPNGSEVRAFRVIGQGDAYNQRGELVMRGTYRKVEVFKRYVDESKNVPLARSVRYMSDYRPAHMYTPEDWEYIKSLWASEKIRGSDTLYWEDVSIGDEPVRTCDGPYTAINMIAQHYDSIINSIRDTLMHGDAGRLERDELGMLYHDWAQHYCDRNHPGSRPVFYNHTARNHVIRMLTNWIGDDGMVSRIGWRLISEREKQDRCNMFPESYDRPSVLLKVPYLKEAGKYLNVHGMVNDLVISRGYVYDKYIKDGRHYVELACWCENLEGDIMQECPATVILPSRS